MDVELFCASNPDANEILLRLARGVRQLIDPAITTLMNNAETSGGEALFGMASRYTKLLHASIPPERQLLVRAVPGFDIFGLRVYIRVYWHLLAFGTYYHWAYGWVDGEYWTDYEQRFHGLGRGLEKFMPAVAIRDRMVVVPRGQAALLQELGSRAGDLPPLERPTVYEVDFTNAESLNAALRQVGADLRAELRHELMAYRSYRMNEKDDFETVAALLGVPPSLLRAALDEEADERELHLQSVTATLRPTVIVTGVQSRVRLTLENPSGADLGRLRACLRGPVDGMQVNPEMVPVELAAGSRADVDFSISTSRPGEFAVELLLLDPAVNVLRDPHPRIMWLTSGSATPVE